MRKIPLILMCIAVVSNEWSLPANTAIITAQNNTNYIAIDLNPAAGFDYMPSRICGNEQIGTASVQIGHGKIAELPILSLILPSSLAILKSDQQIVVQYHAFLWKSTTANMIDLTPKNFNGSFGCATDGLHQVGWGFGLATDNHAHALLWTGTAGSAIDLNPKGYIASSAYGVLGNQQVGSVIIGTDEDGPLHAIMWTGTAASCIDLHPVRFQESMALATNGSQQVGWGGSRRVGGGTVVSGITHALLWYGTAKSVVDLNPKGLTWSKALDICGSQEVGYGIVNGKCYINGSIIDGGVNHALLWFGSVSSCIDLNPAGFASSEAVATNGIQQVGDGQPIPKPIHGRPFGSEDYNHALVWNGAANKVVDLQRFLPKGFSNSFATDINVQGEIVGYAYDRSGNIHAFEWIPESATTQP
jgi:probable HAF family extracellular repeat protein